MSKLENDVIPKINELKTIIVNYAIENEDILSSIESFKISIVEKKLNECIKCLKED